MDEQLEIMRDNAERAGDLHRLIERLEKAEGPDRALDNDIWAVLGQPLPDDPVDCPARYTSSIDAALTLVPDQRWDWSVGHMAGWKCFANITSPALFDWPVRCAATPAIALCIAALKAREAVSGC